MGKAVLETFSSSFSRNSLHTTKKSADPTYGFHARRSSYPYLCARFCRDSIALA